MTAARDQGRGAAEGTENSAEARAGRIARQSAGEAAAQPTERLAAHARDGARQVGAAASAAADTALRSGSAFAQSMQDVTTAWTRYAEEVMRQTSEASRALMSCHSFAEMLEVQARLLRGNLQAFLDQSTRIADIAGRMTAHPFEAMKQPGDDQTRR